MKHNTHFLLLVLALLLAACVSAPTDDDYPIPGLDPRPTATLIPGTLIVTVNVAGDPRPQGDWSGWTISEQLIPEFLETNCTLYRLPDTAPQQWVGMCRMGIQEVFALPWTTSDIMAVVEDLEGHIEVYQSQVVARKK